MEVENAPMLLNFHPLGDGPNMLNIRTPTTEELTAISALVVAFTIARYSFQGVVKHALSKSKIDPSKHQKFGESAWKVLYYSIVWSWAVLVVCTKDFFWDTKLCWDKRTQMDEAFRYLFLVQLAFYIHSLITHVTIETRRKDYVQMLVHHVVTSVLIGLSYYYGFAFIGGVLFVLFDICDVLLETGKMTLYAGMNQASNLIFAGLILSWFGLRIVLYPAKILYSASVESIQMIDINAVPGGYRIYVLFVGMLFMIGLLNVYWFYLMLGIMWKAVTGSSKVEDSREDDD